MLLGLIFCVSCAAETIDDEGDLGRVDSALVTSYTTKNAPLMTGGTVSSLDQIGYATVTFAGSRTVPECEGFVPSAQYPTCTNNSFSMLHQAAAPALVQRINWYAMKSDGSVNNTLDLTVQQVPNQAGSGCDPNNFQVTVCPKLVNFDSTVFNFDCTTSWSTNSLPFHVFSKATKSTPTSWGSTISGVSPTAFGQGASLVLNISYKYVSKAGSSTCRPGVYIGSQTPTFAVTAAVRKSMTDPY